jgi:uncharacterized protein
MSLASIFKSPKALGDGLSQFASSKERVEGGLGGLSYANGLLTAVIVGPEEIPAAEWMSRFIDSTDGELDAEDAKLAMAMMMLQHGKIVKGLRSRGGRYKPFFWEDSEGCLVTRDWAQGFLAGVRLRDEAWKPLRDGKAGDLFVMVTVLLQREDIDAKIVEFGQDPEALFEMALDSVPDWIESLYSTRREQALDARLSERKVGRNDPCPCGSGKKYKKCCLN